MRHLAVLLLLGCGLMAVTAQSDERYNLADRIAKKFRGSDAGNEIRRRVIMRRLKEMDTSDMEPEDAKKLKDAFKSGNFGEIKAETITRMKDADLISLVPVEKLMKTMKKEEFENLSRFLSGQVNPGFRKLLEEMKTYGMTQNELIRELDNTLDRPTISKSRITMLLNTLADPEEVTAQDVTEFKDILFKIPNKWLMEIENAEAIKEICKQSDLCIRSGSGGESKSRTCPSENEMLGVADTKRAKKMMNLRTWCLQETMGDPEDWTAADFDKLEKLERVPMELLEEVDDKLLSDRHSEIILLFNNRRDLEEKYGRIFTEKIIDHRNFEDITNSNDLADEIRKLGTLRKYVMIGDVNSEALTSSLRSEINQNLQNSLKKQQMDGRSMRTIARNTRAKRGKLTAADCTQMGELVSMLDSNSIQACLKSNVLSDNQIREVVKSVQDIGGVGKRGKMRKLFQKMRTIARTNNGQIDINSLPREMSALLKPKDVAGFSSASTNAFFSKNIEMPTAVTGTIMSKVSSAQISNLPANGRALAPISKVMNSQSSTKTRVAKDLPATSPLAKLAMDASFRNKQDIRESDIRNNPDVVPFMGKKEAMKIRRDDVMAVMEEVAIDGLSIDFCFALLDRYVNISAMDKKTEGTNEAVLTLNPLQIEKMPPCVIAAAGRSTIEQLDDTSKQIVMENLGKIKNPLVSSGMNRKTMQKIIEEGLEAYDTKKLTDEDVDSLGVLLAHAPPNLLKTLEGEGLEMFLMQLNEVAQSVIMPCLDGDRQNAIGKLIEKYMKMPPSQWKDVRSVNCLLHMLEDPTLNEIDAVTLSAASCDDKKDVSLYKSMIDVLDADCIAEGFKQMTERSEKSLKRKQQTLYMREVLDVPEESSTRRRKRATSDIDMCDRAALSGVDDISSSELDRLTKEQLEGCLLDLCQNPMNEDKAKVIVRKLKEQLQSNDIKNMEKTTLESMEYCMRGFSVSDIENLPTLSYPNDNNIVATMGITGDRDPMFSSSQKMALAKKVKEEWKSGGLSAWNSADVLMVNGLLCQYGEEDIMKIDRNAFKETLPFINDIECPLDPQTTAFMKKAEEAFGDVKQWSQSHVAEIGSLIAGISPESMKNLPADAMAGFTAMAMKKLPPSLASVMEVEQIENLAGHTARAVTGDQKARMSEEQKQAIQGQLTNDPGDGAGALQVTSLALLLSSFVVVMLNRH